MRQLAIALLISMCVAGCSPMSAIERLLSAHREHVKPILPDEYLSGRIYCFDLTANNKKFAAIDQQSTAALIEYTREIKEASQADLLVGKYFEDRDLYKRSQLFTEGNDIRTIHLGMDLSVPAGTPVYAPFAGRVEVIEQELDFAGYGTMMILSHQLGSETIYSLYGHLAATMVENIKVGASITPGQIIARVGAPTENGGWPTHLHFQLIDQHLFAQSDFSGVASKGRAEYYREHTADPEIILNTGCTLGIL